MVGDLKNGRTVHSLCKLLSHFKLKALHLVAPPSLRMPQTVLDGLTQRGIPFTQHESLDAVMKDTDVLYGQWKSALRTHPRSATASVRSLHSALASICLVLLCSVTRVQKERFASLPDYDAVKDSFIITPELLSRLAAKASLRILHPLPRVNELSAELDADPRCAIFRQMKHGMHVRMAIIAAMMGKA